MQYKTTTVQPVTINTMSSYSRNGTNNGDSSSDRQRGSGYGGGERYIPRDGDDRRDDRRDDRHDDRRDDSRRQDYAAPTTRPSICIPRTFTTIRGEQTKRAVFRTFKDLRIGFIERIDTVHKTDKNGERYCTVYVHLKWNMENNLARDTRQKLVHGKEIKVVYDEPWFWKCTASTIEKPENRYADTQPRNNARPRIDLGEGARALSRYTCEDDEQRDPRDEQKEQHNQEQLCNTEREYDEE
jgi:hypothetical protein